ncbi:MAG: hypothetical protein LUE98_01290 [Tannerellaceae bacterium]|nr:hypothetical protein [Tannerellaceae bacterium]
MKKAFIFILIIFLLFLIYALDILYNGAPHTYRKEFKGVVYDIESGLPIKDAFIVFIQDTLTLGNTYGTKNMNIDENCQTNKKGIFKIPPIKDRYWRESPFLSDLSWVITISRENYVTDTIDLRNWKRVDDKPILDTIWIKPIPPLNEIVIE